MRDWRKIGGKGGGKLMEREGMWKEIEGGERAAEETGEDD